MCKVMGVTVSMCKFMWVTVSLYTVYSYVGDSVHV